jgi:hypothetical protein
VGRERQRVAAIEKVVVSRSYDKRASRKTSKPMRYIIDVATGSVAS